MGRASADPGYAARYRLPMIDPYIDSFDEEPLPVVGLLPGGRHVLRLETRSAGFSMRRRLEQRRTGKPPQSCVEDRHIETKIDRVLQKDGDVSQNWLDFPLSLLSGLYLFDG
jgi:hypothetical protein